MKIGLFVPGGVDRSGVYRVIPCLLWLIERLAKRHEVHVFALYQERERSRYELRGATVHNIGSKLTGFRALAEFFAEHRRAPFDVIHAFWATPPGVLAVFAGFVLRRPVLLHIAGGELVSLPEISYGGRLTLTGRLWVRIAVRGASRMTVASATMQELAASLGIQAGRLTLGVDIGKWPVRKATRRQLGDPARVLNVGSINRVKDQHTLIKTAALLVRRAIPFHLDIVGADTLDREIEKKVADLGLLEHVTFHGFLPHPGVRTLVESADILLVTSRHEAGPVTVLEAAVAGVPTVGTAVGHINDWAPDAAVAVPVGDYEALARETEALLSDEARRLKIAEAAQENAVAEDADWTAARILDIYDALIAQ